MGKKHVLKAYPVVHVSGLRVGWMRPEEYAKAVRYGRRPRVLAYYCSEETAMAASRRHAARGLCAVNAPRVPKE